MEPPVSAMRARSERSAWPTCRLQADTGGDIADGDVIAEVVDDVHCARARRLGGGRSPRRRCSARVFEH